MMNIQQCVMWEVWWRIFYDAGQTSFFERCMFLYVCVKYCKTVCCALYMYVEQNMNSVRKMLK